MSEGQEHVRLTGGFVGMVDEIWFRSTLVVVILVTMGIVLFHRWEASSSDEFISHHEEGWLYASMLRIAGLLLWLTTFSYLLFPSSVAWASVPVFVEVRLLAVMAAIVSTALFHWTLSSLGSNLTDTVVTRKHAVLVKHGPYRWVRHPYYVCAGLLMASVTVLTANWAIGLSSVFVLTLLVARTPKEEKMLIQRFGDEYRRYIETTGAFLPRFRR